jgi:hypothetical protein
LGLAMLLLEMLIPRFGTRRAKNTEVTA